MLQDIHIDLGTRTDDAIANVQIWCTNNAIAKRLYTLLVPALPEAHVHLLERWDPLNGQQNEKPTLLISDNMAAIETIDEWLIQQPDPWVSLMYIYSKSQEDAVSQERFSRYKVLFRLEKEYLNYSDTLVRGVLYPILNDQMRMQEETKQKVESLVEYTKKQLAVFYHNINNPLTVLSGNLQLLKILSDSSELPADVQKSIQDISDITHRFEKDLGIISALRERIDECIT